MKFLLALVVALSLTFAFQSAVVADSHGEAKESVEKAAEKMKDAGEKEMKEKEKKKKKKKGKDEEDPDCE